MPGPEWKYAGPYCVVGVVVVSEKHLVWSLRELRMKFSFPCHRTSGPLISMLIKSIPRCIPRNFIIS